MPAYQIDTNDDDIADIFVEEAEEVLETMDGHLAVWKQRPTDKTALTEIRRGFHTLKGSGRMVKALDLGELAWKIENMLNRALEGTVQVSEPMLGLVAATRKAMPKLVHAFKEGRKTDNEAEVESLMAQADALAAGKLPSAPTRPAAAPHATAAAGGDEIAGKLSELYRRAERSSQRADEALHRSEMALQQVRQLSSQIRAMETGSQDRTSRAELAPLVERLNALTKEVLDLRLAAKKAQTEPALTAREIQQLIDNRMRERPAASERLRPEIERQLEPLRQSVELTRSLAIGALVLGLALAGAAVATVAMLIG